MRKFTPETIAATVELQQLVADYWRDVDFNDARNVPNFFTEDCVYVGGPQLTFSGRAGIAKFYDTLRTTRPRDRIVRHTVTNLQVMVHDTASAAVNYTIVSYAQSGTPPITGLSGPSQVTDIQLDYRRQPDGAWRIAKFHGQPIFLGAESLLKALSKG